MQILNVSNVSVRYVDDIVCRVTKYKELLTSIKTKLHIPWLTVRMIYTCKVLYFPILYNIIN